MTQSEFTELLKHPEKVSAQHITDLKEITEFYPYFALPALLLAKAQKDAQNIHSQKYVDSAVLLCPDRRWFYYYIFPEKKLHADHSKFERTPKFSGDYFDILNAADAEGGDQKQTLKNLAEKLKLARSMTSGVKTAVGAHSETSFQSAPAEKTVPVLSAEMDETSEISEDNVKTLIKEKRYSEAIEILNKLNLIYPKKSVYFADQIRFLEKVVVNSKK